MTVSYDITSAHPRTVTNCVQRIRIWLVHSHQTVIQQSQVSPVLSCSLAPYQELADRTFEQDRSQVN